MELELDSVMILSKNMRIKIRKSVSPTFRKIRSRLDLVTVSCILALLIMYSTEDRFSSVGLILQLHLSSGHVNDKLLHYIHMQPNECVS